MFRKSMQHTPTTNHPLYLTFSYQIPLFFSRWSISNYVHEILYLLSSFNVYFIYRFYIRYDIHTPSMQKITHTFMKHNMHDLINTGFEFEAVWRKLFVIIKNTVILSFWDSWFLDSKKEEFTSDHNIYI